MIIIHVLIKIKTQITMQLINRFGQSQFNLPTANRNVVWPLCLVCSDVYTSLNKHNVYTINTD